MTKKHNQNFLMFLAGFLVVALGFMSFVLLKQKPIKPDPLDSDEVLAIEANINDTDLDGLDADILQVENELKQSD